MHIETTMTVTMVSTRITQDDDVHIYKNWFFYMKNSASKNPNKILISLVTYQDNHCVIQSCGHYFDEDEVFYYIDLGDSSNTGWFGPYESGIEVTKSHTWTTKVAYTLKGKDTSDRERDWVELEVSMLLGYPPSSTLISLSISSKDIYFTKSVIFFSNLFFFLFFNTRF